jgi:tRNA threonylcarbamoyladenosine biosynthesis protein TsaB
VHVIVALETSSEVGGVALVADQRVLAERVLGAREHAARELLPALDAALRETGRGFDAVRAIAVSIGPGSFTGLRIGLATALGLCFGTELRIVPVPTLAALALRAELPEDSSEPVAALLDARKGQVYAGLYTARGDALAEDRVCDALPFLHSLRAERVTLIGPGAELYRSEIEAVLGPRARVLPPERGWPSAASVGLLGERLAALGSLVPAGEVQLRYLRASQAEVEAAAAAGKNAPGTLDTPLQNA